LLYCQTTNLTVEGLPQNNLAFSVENALVSESSMSEIAIREHMTRTGWDEMGQ
jgi:hypothetical protein